MKVDNTTYTTHLRNWALGSLVGEAIGHIQSRPGMIAQNDEVLITPIASEELDFTKASIGSRLGTGIYKVEMSAPMRGSAVIPLKGKVDIREYNVLFGRRFTSPAKIVYDFFVPINAETLYVVQGREGERAFVQWAQHQHDAEKERIIGNAQYALFQKVRAPVLPLVALICGQDVLSMGDSCVGATGYFRTGNAPPH